MIKKLGNRRPLVLIFIKTLPDEMFCIFGNVAPAPTTKTNLLITDVLVNPIQILCIEWRFSAKQLIYNDTKTPNVNLLSIPLMLYKFRCHVQGRAQYKVEAFFFIELLRKSQICNFDIKAIFIIFYQKNVFGLEVPVRNLLQMHIIQSKHNLANDVGCLTLCKAI